MTGPAPAGPWFDSHCHLQERYRPDDTGEAEALEQAALAGVGGLVCIGTDAESSVEALRLVERARHSQSNVFTWATVGLHPHDAVKGIEGLEAVLSGAMAHQRDLVVAVGECGLDYHYDHSPRAAQREMFASQIDLARRHGLALVVHSRAAWDDTLSMLGTDTPPRLVLHCFTGGAEEARRCLDLGAYLSFSGIITFKNAHDVRDAAALCPVDRLLVETDAPFLAPVPHRGSENRPAWVPVVGAAVAEVKGLDPLELAETSRSAAQRVFQLSDG